MEKVVGLKALPQEIDDSVYIQHRWPLIIDEQGKAASFLRYNSRVVNAMFPDEVTPENLRKALVNTLKSGVWLTFNFDVFEGDLSAFFSAEFPETVMDVNEVMKDEFLRGLAQEGELKVGKDDLIPRAGFKLVIVTKRPDPSPWFQTHCFILKVDHTLVETEKKEFQEFKLQRLPEEERKKKCALLSDDLIEACFDGAPVAQVKGMLEAGADIWYVNISGETPLTEAALKGHLELVQWLLTVDGAGLDPNHKNSHGQTALFNAAYNGHKEVVQVLLENGADPTIRTTTMETASGAALNDETRALIDSWDVSQVSAIRQQKEKLRDEKAEASFRSDLERDHYYHEKKRCLPHRLAIVKSATEGDWLALEDQLLEGGNVESRDEFGKTLLNISANAGFETIATELVEKYDANIEATDSKGWTPLMSAAHNGHEKVVRYLLGRGASMEARNSYGMDVFTLAHPDIKPILTAPRPVIAQVEEIKTIEKPAEEHKPAGDKKGGKAAGKSGPAKKSGVKKGGTKPGAKPSGAKKGGK